MDSFDIGVTEGMVKVAISEKTRGTALAERLHRTLVEGGASKKLWGERGRHMYDAALDLLPRRPYAWAESEGKAMSALPHFHKAMISKGRWVR